MTIDGPRRPRSPEDKTVTAAAATAGLLQALFASLRLAGATDWSWWAVMSPALAAGALLAGCAALILAWAALANRQAGQS